MKGKIIKGIAGFYYVHVPAKNMIFECKAKGIFRKQNIKPLVGDDVEINTHSQPEGSGIIESIFPRKNELVRPAVANVDQAMVIFAVAEPKPNLNLLDRFLISMNRQKVKAVVCFNKADLVGNDETTLLKNIYEQSRYEVLTISVLNEEEIKKVRGHLKDKTTVLAGPSGVGKSSLVNLINPEANMEIGKVSKKIKRGKHTTRHSELIYVDEDTYIMDTPGFSTLYIDDIEERDLKDYYPEFTALEAGCKFIGCMHINEPQCAVKDALEEGEISRIRYDNYLLIYNELKDVKRY